MESKTEITVPLKFDKDCNISRVDGKSFFEGAPRDHHGNFDMSKVYLEMKYYMTLTQNGKELKYNKELKCYELI